MENNLYLSNERGYFELLREMCENDFENKFATEQLDQASIILEKELEIIKAKGLELNFYLIAEMVKSARDKGLVVTQRGAANGSIVAYTSGITDINPLDYELSYESFLGPNGESEPYFDMNIADNATRDVMAEKIREIYPQGEVYVESGPEAYPNAIVILTEADIAKFEPERRALFARAASDRRVQLDVEGARLYSELRPLVIRLIVNDSIYMLQETWHQTGVRPSRGKSEIENVFKEYMSQRGFFPDESKPFVSMCYNSLVLEAITEKMNVASVRELIDAYSLSCVCGSWDDEVVKIIAEGLVHNKQSIWRVCDRENVYSALISIGAKPEKAFDFVEDLRKGRLCKEKYAPKWESTFEELKASGAPIWYRTILNRTGYLFPRAHSAGCVVTILQLMQYRFQYPEVFYKFWIEKRKSELTVYEKALAAGDFQGIIDEYYIELSSMEYIVALKLKLA